MAERQAKVACLLPECSRCALHGSCNLLDWRLASRVCPQLSDILLGPGSTFSAPRSFGCHQIPHIDDALSIFRLLNELVDFRPARNNPPNWRGSCTTAWSLRPLTCDSGAVLTLFSPQGYE